jgi:hypothetical protein
METDRDPEYECDCECDTSDCECSGEETDSECENEEYWNNDDEVKSTARIQFDNAGQVKHKSTVFNLTATVKYKKYYRPLSHVKCMNNNIGYPVIGDVIDYDGGIGVHLGYAGREREHMCYLPLYGGLNADIDYSDSRDWSRKLGHIDIQAVFNAIITNYRT